MHEKRLVVTQGQIKQFSEAVNDASQQVNDLAERMEKLAAKLANNTP